MQINIQKRTLELSVLQDGKADAALAASLFHFKELEIKEVKQYMKDSGIDVRM